MTTITAASVKELREMTGVAMMDCKKALVECNGDLEGAKEYLRKKGQAKAMKKSSRETSEGAISTFFGEDRKSAAMVKVACETDFVARNDSFQELLQVLAQQVEQQGPDNLLAQTVNNAEATVQELLTEKIAELGENMQLLESDRLRVENGIVGGYVHMTGKIGVLVPLETDAPCTDQRLQTLARDIAMHVAAFPAEAVSADQVDQAVIDREKDILSVQARESGKPENIIDKMIAGRLKKYLREICVETQDFVKDPQITVEQLVQEVSAELGIGISFTSFLKYQF